jgi:hypothetical protein
MLIMPWRPYYAAGTVYALEASAPLGGRRACSGLAPGPMNHASTSDQIKELDRR